MSVNISFPSPDSYDKWEVWGKALVRGLIVIFSYTQIIQDIGSISSFPNSITPSGWLKCNGSNFDGNGYPVLFQYLGTNTLPSLTSPFGAGYTVWMKAG